MTDPIEWTQIDEIPIGGGVMGRRWRHITRPLVAIVSRELDRWHMSLSHRDRMPDWTEIGIARDALLPADVHFCMPHPARKYWLNYNHRVLHLFELRDPELIEQMEFEGNEARRRGYGTPS